jgi:hypothetical protein
MRRPLSASVLLAVVLCGCPSEKDAPAPVTQQSCSNAVRDPVLPSEMIQDLGTLQVGTDATFAVGAGAAGFFIFSQEVGDSAPDTVLVNQSGVFAIPNTVVPRRVIAPSGTTYYDDFEPWPVVTIDGHGGYADVTGLLGYDVGFQAVSAAFPIPNTSGALAKIDSTAGQVEPGTWHFTVSDWAFDCPFTGCSDGSASGRYRVHVVTVPGASARSTLDVEVYLATDPTSALSTAAGAAVHPQVARWKQSLASYLANGGITLGQVSFHDLLPEVKARYAPNGDVDVSTSGPCSDLNQLFTAAVVPSRAVHVFFADDLIDRTPSDGFSTAGVDGSIPGPSGFPGTIYGGAIVGLQNFGFESSPGACSGSGAPALPTCGTDHVAYVTAHEIGHWLGLYHTTESAGTFFDPMSDTERCPCFSCAPAGALRNACGGTTNVSNEMCVTGPSCGGGRNLMFWLLDERVSTGELSPDQGRIMRVNPAVH